MNLRLLHLLLGRQVLYHSCRLGSLLLLLVWETEGLSGPSSWPAETARCLPYFLLPAPNPPAGQGQEGKGGLPLFLSAVCQLYFLLRNLWKGLNNKASDDRCPSSQGQKDTEMSPWSRRPAAPCSTPSQARAARSRGPPSLQPLFPSHSLLSLLWRSFKSHLVQRFPTFVAPGTVLWKTIFPWTGVGGWFWDGSRALHSLCTFCSYYISSIQIIRH